MAACGKGLRPCRVPARDIRRSGTDCERAEKINASYVSRVLRLTLLAPEIVDAILDGRQPAGMALALLIKPFPAGWREQVQAFCS
jgi:hypothetical protein